MDLYELRNVANLALDVIAGDPSILESRGLRLVVRAADR